MRPYEAAKELANQYGIEHRVFGHVTAGKEIKIGLYFTPILPVPKNAPEPTRRHSQYGMCVKPWSYLNAFGELMFCTARFDLADGKVVLPQCYGRFGKSHKQWCWKSLPDSRPLYGLPKLRSMPQATVLLVEGEKTADAAQSLLPEYVAMTWSGGSKAIAKSDFSPLSERNIVIWPDNDNPARNVAIDGDCPKTRRNHDVARLPGILAKHLPEFVKGAYRTCGQYHQQGGSADNKVGPCIRSPGWQGHNQSAAFAGNVCNVEICRSVRPVHIW